MNNSLVYFLNQNDVDNETIFEAARLYLKESLSYISDESIEEKLYTSSTSEESLKKYLKELEKNETTLIESSLFILSQAWENVSEVERIKKIIKASKRKLTILELSLLSLVSAYGVLYMLHLMNTGGKKSHKIKREVKTDGTILYEEETEFFSSPLPKLNDIIDLNKLFDKDK